MDNSEATQDEILTVEEVAKWLRVTPEWVRAHANRNRRPFLPSFKMGRSRRFRRKDIVKFIEEMVALSTAQTEKKDRTSTATTR